MAQLPSVFNEEKTATMGFTPIPEGWYLIEMKKSEMKRNSAKTGSYLNCQFVVLEGEFKGRFLFALLNLDNPSQVAVEIAEKEMTTMRIACGLESVEDSVELHDIPMAAKVAIQAEDAKWPAKNIIKDYKPEAEMPDEEESDDSPFG